MSSIKLDGEVMTLGGRALACDSVWVGGNADGKTGMNIVIGMMGTPMAFYDFDTPKDAREFAAAIIERAESHERSVN